MYELHNAVPETSLMTTTLSPAQRQAAESLTQAIGTLNGVIERAVEAGLTVELTRTRRSHSPCGTWGDQVKAQLTPTAKQ